MTVVTLLMLLTFVSISNALDFVIVSVVTIVAVVIFVLLLLIPLHLLLLPLTCYLMPLLITDLVSARMVVIETSVAVTTSAVVAGLKTLFTRVTSTSLVWLLYSVIALLIYT